MKISRKIFALLIVCAVLAGSGIRAYAAIEHDLSTIDNKRHSPDEFLRLVKEIKGYVPYYTLQQIGGWIYVAYKEVRKLYPDMTVWDVGQELKAEAKDNGKNMQFKEITENYILRKTEP